MSLDLVLLSLTRKLSIKYTLYNMFVLEMAKRCVTKSSALYNNLDNSNGFYKYVYLANNAILLGYRVFALI